jgi:hypothetical protein
MAENYFAFQTFYDSKLANEVAETLIKNSIDCVVEDCRNAVDNPIIATNSLDAKIVLKLHPEDFTKANEVLEDFYKSQTNNVDKDYYLFNFSDEQLMDVIAKPDEWGVFNYQLAKKILEDKGKDISSETLETLKQQRLEELSQPKKASKNTIIPGYILAFLLPIIAVFIGGNLLFGKKTLPDGNKILVYRKEDRKQGKIILWISIIHLITSIVATIRFYANGGNM